MPELGVGFLFTRIGGDAEEAREDADDIAIKNGRGLIERDAANGAGGVAADAGQREDLVEVGGELAAMLRDELLRGALQVADAGVVAEAFPEFVQLGERGLGGGLDGGQFAHPTLPIGDDGFHLRLLEHDFGYPDGVGIAGAAPREVAGVGGEPAK